ncbi:MAG: Gfo/Idh/MocA family oxidoreductase [Planctomycetota bacterium]|nr:Gfo/Idh/MocA family oxidoreductase [Planctomycetota bacterium]
MLKRTAVSRREFLKGAAALALAGPYVVTSAALGAGDRPAASNRITMAHIGIGNQGSGHFGGMLGNAEAQILAVGDVRQWVRDKCQKAVEDRYGQAKASGEYKGCAAYNDFREIAARTDIDATVVAVPDHWHALVAIELLKSGKDVYCEKPLALTIKQARAMVTATRRYGRVFQTGSQQRSSAEFRKACELVRNGRIGKVLTVNVNVGGPSTERYYPEEPIPEGFDWEFWLGPAPWAPHNSERCSGNYGGGWRMVRDYSGGMMTDWGAHHFDIAQWGLGMDNTGPVEILPPDGKDVPRLTYKYANGVVMYHGGGGNGVLFTGEKGKVEVNRGYFKSYPDEIGQEPLGPSDIRLYASNNHMADFFQCMKTRQRPICDVEIGCRSVSVCHLGNIAVWINRPLKWDPVKEEIIGDPEASRWLDRPMRAPWHLG